MARDFTATSDKISCGATTMPATGSLGFWLYPSWSSTDGIEHSLFDQRSAPNYFTFSKYTDNKLYTGWLVGGVDHRVVVNSGSYTLNTNAWNRFDLVWDDAANLSTLYLNGVSIGTKGTLVTATITGARTVGNLAAGGVDARGRIAELAIWNSTLSTGSIAALAKGVSPASVQRSSLTDYFPLIGRDSPEPNLRGGTAGTLTGTAQADHPRVYYPGRRRTVFVPGAGGGTVVSGYGTAAGVNLTTAESQARFATFGAAGGSNSGVGEGRSRHQSAGTAAGTASVVGVSAARVEAVGAAAGSNVSTGVGRIRKAGSGVAAGTNSATGASQARAALIGAAAGTNDTDAVSRALWEASGSADGTNTATGYIIDGNAPPTWMRNLQILKKGVS